MTDFTRKLTDLDGNGITETVIAAGEPRQAPLTLARVAANALIQAYPDEAAMSGAEKVRLFALAMKVMDPGPTELAPADIATIKERIARAYGPLIVGRAFALLDEAMPAADQAEG